MRIREGDSLARQPVEVGCLKLGVRIQATCVTVALIVSVDDDDIGVIHSMSDFCQDHHRSEYECENSHCFHWYFSVGASDVGGNNFDD